MTKIGLISDTHNYLDDAVFHHFEDVDEIWHAGDFGNIQLAGQLQSFKPLKGVYGNIDGYDVRSMFPEILCWHCEEVKVLMIHIGGYPGRYSPLAKKEIVKHQPAMFISGHSHILKIIFDQQYNCLHINPGAAGLQGWHKVQTLVRFSIDGKEIKNAQVIELKRRSGQIT